MTDMDVSRRFGGIARLYGEAALTRFLGAHVAVVGIGGVGSWVAEALARSAIGTLTLIDLDHVAESNINRQLHALDATLGQAKVTAMAERIQSFNPSAVVHEIDEFVELDNVAQLFTSRFDFVVDAIDNVKVKAAMIAHCRRHKIKMITCGGAGGQLDPTQIGIVDLAKTTQDPLLAKTRSLLRREYGFSKDVKKKFDVPAVFSTEPLQYPTAASCDIDDPLPGPAGLNCAGFGSSACVTGAFGLAAASYVLRKLAQAAG
ncbi:tRNA A37 threonylcarbamoyladenosine dehydratase [Chitinivorax tropicus]|uniref:tRNA A37 threonylcarbamoyladenosine dehydratase n=1 Tax=Chitinivorax tropicus TaxID=714531 RepID=A0A840MRB6_9PROT|nr:tRNA cyclic N6-threonylcarbamoyladenosine(37) synthase TcdA [Chitinivorax tropicus]MBB5019332.1 tRNA A37 threonylcarbamoyladenosine dehydratase [Chitinivorax tropicus]